MEREESNARIDLGRQYRESAGSLILLGEFYREESGALHKLMRSPHDLSVSFDGPGCEMDLSWRPDEDNSQNIWRCSGSSCDPQTDGSIIDTVAAGVGIYDDDMTGISLNTTVRYRIVSAAGRTSIAGALREDCGTPTSGPTNLSVVFDGVNCEMDLTWDPDTTDDQDIYRCIGNTCDPEADGALIATRPANIGGYQDDMTGVLRGSNVRYRIVSVNGNTNIRDDTRGFC